MGERPAPVGDLGAEDAGEDRARADERPDPVGDLCAEDTGVDRLRGGSAGSRRRSRRRGRHAGQIADRSRRPPQHAGQGMRRARTHRPPRLAGQGTRLRLGPGKRRRAEPINSAGFRSALPRTLQGEDLFLFFGLSSSYPFFTFDSPHRKRRPDAPRNARPDQFCRLTRRAAA